MDDYDAPSGGSRSNGGLGRSQQREEDQSTIARTGSQVLPSHALAIPCPTIIPLHHHHAPPPLHQRHAAPPVPAGAFPPPPQQQQEPHHHCGGGYQPAPAAPGDDLIRQW